jgi:hypothetical protein
VKGVDGEERTRWGKAGVRLTGREAAAIDSRNARRHAEAKLVAERDEREGRDAWARGLIRPWAITLALNARGLYGPQVDEACGTVEPAVDTWDELKALAELTLYPIAFFTTAAHEAIAVEDASLRFTLRPGEDAPPRPVLCFEPAAIEAATGTTRCPHCGLSSRPIASLSEFRVRNGRV